MHPNIVRPGDTEYEFYGFVSTGLIFRKKSFISCISCGICGTEDVTEGDNLLIINYRSSPITLFMNYRLNIESRCTKCGFESFGFVFGNWIFLFKPFCDIFVSLLAAV